MSLFLALGFCFCQILDDILLIICFGTIFSIYLYLRFHNVNTIIIFLIAIFISCIMIEKPEVPSSGEYSVIEIKNNYCIARNDGISIIIYETDANYGDIYHVDTFERVHTDDNLTLFSFSNYLGKRNIYYYAKDATFKNSQYSIRSIIYNKIDHHAHSELLKTMYYGICTEDDVFGMLGSGIISAYYFLNWVLNHFIPENKTRVVLLMISIIFGYCFYFSFALLRLIVYQLSIMMTDKKYDQLAFMIASLTILAPYELTNFGFVLPICMRLIMILCHEHRFMVQKMTLVALMLIYFHELNLVSFLCFEQLRSLYGFFFFLGWFIDLSWFTIPELTFNLAPDIFFIISFIIIFYLSLQQFKYRYLFILVSCMFLSVYSPFFKVYVINIGQGDCTLIVEPFKQSAIMIDVGQNLYRDNVEKIIYPFLKNKHIHNLDALILTHDDYDHSGGYDALKEKVDIKNVIKDSNQKVDVDYPMYFLLPERESDNVNDNSIVTYFSYDDINYLWMGDASVNIEKQVLEKYDINCDILKVGHHGSATSSSFDFLNKLDPELALISVGHDNRYGHPATEVVSRLYHLGIDTLETKDVGMIAICSYHDFAFFLTASGLFGIIN